MLKLFKKVRKYNCTKSRIISIKELLFIFT